MEFTKEQWESFGVVLKANFIAGLAGVAPMWDKVATEVPSTKAGNKYKWLGKWPRLRKWLGPRRIKELSSHNYAIENEKFESTVEVELEDIEDGDLVSYPVLSSAEGVAAGQWPDQIVFGLLKLGFETPCYDGQNFFDTDHLGFDADGNEVSYSNMQAGAGATWYLLDTSKPIKPLIFQPRVKPQFANHVDPAKSDYVFTNDKVLFGTRARGAAGFGLYELAFASKDTLNEANFDAAYNAMTAQLGEDGNPLGVTPMLLVVPSSMRTQANEVIKRSRKANGEDNTNKDLVEVFICPWL